MAFTRQQVLEMQQKLASLGYKDTDFEILGTENIGGEEWVAVVDNGVNKRMLLGNFEQYIITKNIPDLDEIRQNAELGSTAYHMPNGGIPRSDLSGDVQGSLGRADRAVQPSTLQRALNTKQDKLTFDDYPEAGSENPVKSDGIYQAIQDIDKIESISVNGNNIPKDIHGNVDIEVPDELKDLADDTDHRLVSDAEKEFWNNKYDFPSGGIPASDLAPGVIPDLSRYITKWVNDLVYYYKKNETYSRQEIDVLVSGFQQYAPVVVEELPDPTADTMYHLYLAPSEDPQEENVYNEYITVDFGESANPRYQWEQVGSTAIKMGDYPQRYTLEYPLDFDNIKAGDILDTGEGNFVATTVFEGNESLNPSVVWSLLYDGRIYTVTFEKSGGQWSQTGASVIDIEDKGNKVSSWSATPNNDNYPSEKLVKDSLDAKQDTISDLADIRSGAAAGATAYQKPVTGIAEGDLDTSVTAKLNKEEIYWVTYGTTSRADIIAAVSAGKVCVCKYNNDIYYCVVCNTTAGNTNNIFFTRNDRGMISSVYVDGNNGWGGPMGYTAENSNNRVSTIEGNESNTTKYPNTKAVADALAEKQDVLVAGTNIEIIEGLAVELPEGYKAVEYLQSSGTQYIDTDVALNVGNIGYDVEFLTDNPFAASGSSYGAVLGGRAGSGNNDVQLSTYGSTGGTVRYGSSTGYSPNIVRNMRMSVSLINNVLKSSNTSTSTDIPAYTFNSTNKIYLFGLNNGGTFAQSGGGCRIYRAKFYSGSTVIADMVPAQRLSDSAFGMYDIVRNRFLEKSGTGNFSAGPFVSSQTTINFVNDSGFITSADVPTISTDIFVDIDSNTKTASPKAVADYATHFLTAGAKKIWVGTQAEYDLLTPANDTIYFIKED